MANFETTFSGKAMQLPDGQSVFIVYGVTSPLNCQFAHPLSVDGTAHRSLLHFIAYRKAALFGDNHRASAIMRLFNATDAVNMSKNIRDYKPEVWEAERGAILTKGTEAKAHRFSKGMYALSGGLLIGHSFN